MAPNKVRCYSTPPEAKQEPSEQDDAIAGLGPGLEVDVESLISDYAAAKQQDTQEARINDAVPKDFLSKAHPVGSITLGVVKESDDLRVVQTPTTVAKLVEAGFRVTVQPGAGLAASFPDQAYIDAGAEVGDAWSKGDIILKINVPSAEELQRVGGRTLLSLFQPALNPELLEQLASQGGSAVALDAVPRMLSRAQAFDVLSSQANIAVSLSLPLPLVLSLPAPLVLDPSALPAAHAC